MKCILNGKTVTQELTKKYPQLAQVTDTDFVASEEDALYILQTTAGPVEAVYLAERADFELAVKQIAYKGKNVYLPKTTGAISIFNIPLATQIDSDQKNGNLIILSKGGYSGIPYTKTEFSECEWNEISFQIRVYHECTHFICRRFYHDFIDILWDEILADYTGIVGALKYYDTDLARLFLGISKTGEYTGGRLGNYFPDSVDIQQKTKEALHYIQKLSDTYMNKRQDAVLSLMCVHEKQFIREKIAERLNKTI